MADEFDFRGNDRAWSVCEADEDRGDGSGVSRREFVQLLGAGLLLTVAGDVAVAQRRGPADSAAAGRRTSPPASISARTARSPCMTGKVELGQGARAELTQAAAEELRVAADRIQLIMADTAAGPRRRHHRRQPHHAADRARRPQGRRGRPGTARRPGVQALAGRTQRGGGQGRRHYPRRHQARPCPTPTWPGPKTSPRRSPRRFRPTSRSRRSSQWKVMGTSLPRPNRRDLVTGAHRYPVRHRAARHALRQGAAPAVLRRDAHGRSIWPRPRRWRAWSSCATARSSAARPRRSFRAEQALEAIAKTATWQTVPHPSSKELFAYLKEHAQAGRAAADAPARRRRLCRRSARRRARSVLSQTTRSPTSSTRRWSRGRPWPSGTTAS